MTSSACTPSSVPIESMSAQAGSPRPGIVEDGTRQKVLDLIPNDTPCLLIANKLDHVSEKETLFPFMQKMSALHDFKEIVPMTAKHPDDIARRPANRLPKLIAGSSTV